MVSEGRSRLSPWNEICLRLGLRASGLILKIELVKTRLQLYTPVHNMWKTGISIT